MNNKQVSLFILLIIYLERSIFKMQSDEFVKPLKKKNRHSVDI